jgi:uncharacterized SAM-binding protein YcdF (DUF218 family)
MLHPLFERRSIWWPTTRGWAVLFAVVLIPLAGWFLWGEAFLERSRRFPAEALIIEGWIGIDGVRAAKAEFEQGNYRYLITTGALTDNRWGTQRWNYAVESYELLRRLGVPDDRLIAAPAVETERQRTFTAALAAHDTLARRGVRLSSAIVFTFGAHARRSRLVYAKALPGVDVGVIAWRPAGYVRVPWWQSSERSEDFLKETAGYLYELLLNSGRFSNSSPPPETKP